MAEEVAQAIEEEPETVVDILSEAKVTELDAVLDVNVEITAVLGTTTMPISNVLQLGRGAVVELSRVTDDDIDILANNHLVATGEVVVVDDRLGIGINEVVRLTESITS